MVLTDQGIKKDLGPKGQNSQAIRIDGFVQLLGKEIIEKAQNEHHKPQPHGLMHIIAQAQNTRLVCNGRSLPTLNQLIESASGATNFIPKYSPTVVPNTSQNIAEPRYHKIRFVSLGSILGLLIGLDFFEKKEIMCSVASFRINPFKFSGFRLPESSIFESLTLIVLFMLLAVRGRMYLCSL